jgi:hypothetical protein
LQSWKRNRDIWTKKTRHGRLRKPKTAVYSSRRQEKWGQAGEITKGHWKDFYAKP